jgi:hypothetical protein
VRGMPKLVPIIVGSVSAGHRLQHQNCKKETRFVKKNKPITELSSKIVRPQTLLSLMMPFSMEFLSDNSHLPYDEFIDKVLSNHNEKTGTKITPEMMEVIEYPLAKIKINVPVLTDEYDFEDRFYTLSHQGGFTRGQLLYELAKVVDAWVDEYDDFYWDPNCECYVLQTDYSL